MTSNGPPTSTNDVPPLSPEMAAHLASQGNDGGVPPLSPEMAAHLGGGGGSGTNDAFWSGLGSSPSAGSSSAGVAGSGSAPGGHGFGHWLLNSFVERPINIVKNVPAGVGQLGEDLGRAFTGTGENLVNDVTAIPGALGAPIGRTHFGGPREDPTTGLVASPDVAAAELRKMPALEGIRAGVVRTGMEVRHPTQALKNYSQDPVGSLLNDAGTVALVAGPTEGLLRTAGVGAEAAGAGGAASALNAGAEGAGRAGTVTGKILSAPVRPLLIPFTGADLPAAIAARTGVDRIPGLVDTPAGQAVQAKLSEALTNSRLGGQARDFAERNLRSADLQAKGPTLETLAPLRSRLSPDEQGALTAIMQGEVRQAAPALAQLSPEDRAALFARAFPQESVAPGVRLTPGAAEIALQHEMGALPAEQAARLTRAVDAMQALTETREAKALSGYGTLRGQPVITPAHLEAAPLDKGVLADTAKQHAAVDQATKLESRLGQRAARSALAAERTEDVNLGRSPTANLENQTLVNDRAQARAERSAAAGQRAEQAIGQSAQDRAITEAQRQAGIPTTTGEARSAEIASRLRALRGEPEPAPATYEGNPGLHAFNRAVSDSQRNVIDALHTDAAVGQRGPGFESLSPQERHIYRMVVGEDFAHAKAGELEAARQRLLSTVEDKARRAGTTEGARQGVAQRDQQLLDRATRVRESEEARLTKATADAREAVKNSPAMYRPMREASARFVDQLHGMAQDAEQGGDHNGARLLADVATSIPTSLRDIAERDLQASHLIGTSREGVSGKPGERTPLSSTRATLRRTGGEYVRQGALTERSIPGQAKLELQRISQQSRNAFARQAVDAFGTSADRVLASTDGMRPAEVARAMRAEPEHYIAWQPRGLLGDKATDEAVNARTVFIPKAAYEVFKRYDPVIDSALARGFDRFQTIAYRDRLLLSPAFLFRRAASNVMLMGASDVPLHDIPRLAIEAVRQIKEGTAPRAAIRGGIFDEERGLVSDLPADQPKGLKALAHPVKLGAGASQWIDDAARVATTLSRVEHGMNLDVAVASAGRVLGSYSDLSTVERAYVQRFFPIYGWAKSVARVAATMAEDHPLRTLTLLHLGQIAADDAKNNPSWLQGYIPISGGRFLSSRNLDPFSIFTETPGSFLNPVMRAGLELGLGVNPSNFHELTRPPSEAQHGVVTSPREISYLLAHLDPASRAVSPLLMPIAHRLLGTPNLAAPVARFGTGEPRIKAGKTEPSTGGAGSIESLTGIPLPRRGDLASAARQSAKTTKAQTKAGKRYLTQLRKSGD